MATHDNGLELTIIGAGMIVNDLLLPAALQMKRDGLVSRITVTDMRAAAVKALRESESIRAAFPDQSFETVPSPGEPDGGPELYKQVLARQKPYQLVIIALPDQLHAPVLRGVLPFNQHILCVKPLVLTYREAVEIEREAYARGCFIGVEYHKRCDRRALVARRNCRAGLYGDFALGEARLIEPYYYRHSNFQNWFTCENTDPFVYIGCHYVDLVCFITGLRPASVSVLGRRGAFPNGKTGFLWSSGRVVFENGAILSVNNGLGYPDDAGGSNDQGLIMYFEGDDRGGLLAHNDQNRGVESCAVTDNCKKFQYLSPDFIREVPYAGRGFKPVGYGIDSVCATGVMANRIEAAVAAEASNEPAAALAVRQRFIREADECGLIATPANSKYNELVQEAARLSILNDGRTAVIDWAAAEPAVKLQ